MKRSSSKKGGPAQQPKPPSAEEKEEGALAKLTGPVKMEEEYSNNIKKIATFETVQGFWAVYNHLVRPAALPSTIDTHLFVSTVKPTWEDEANAKGGKFSIRLKKGLSSRYWEELTLALIGSTFASEKLGPWGVNGLVLSVRWNEDILSIWNDEAGKGGDGRGQERRGKIAEACRKILNLPERAVMVSFTFFYSNPNPFLYSSYLEQTRHTLADRLKNTHTNPTREREASLYVTIAPSPPPPL